MTINDKTLTYGLVIVCVVIFITFAIASFGMRLVVDKTTDAVIEKLQRYSPGPYHPAFDPDKINPSFWNPSPDVNDGPKTKDLESPWNDNWTTLRNQ
jgi:hypothetical protein